MLTKLYLNTENLIAGITMMDPAEPEANNMALHACRDKESVLKNRRKLAALLECGLDDFVCARQCHSDDYHKVTREDRGRGAATTDTAVLNTDALYTFEQGLLLCCFTADCVPLIFYEKESGLTGVIHSGWQGTVRGIAPKVLNHLIQDEDCSPKGIKIFIGPAISSEKFEVDRDVRDRFQSLGYADEFISFHEKTGKYHIDNQLTVKKQCELSGIPEENIIIDRTCTFRSPDCFSYRREKDCGRHLSFIVRKNPKV